ncbi:unnamed protein product, partial [Ranitomeya imitator]
NNETYNISLVYFPAQLVCTPYYWRRNTIIMVAALFVVSYLVEVLEQVNPVVYLLAFPPRIGITDTFHVSLLKPVHMSRFSESSAGTSGSSTDDYEEGFIENRRLWLMIKSCFNYRSRSQYRVLERALCDDPMWPPISQTYYSNQSELGNDVQKCVYDNPMFVAKRRKPFTMELSIDHNQWLHCTEQKQCQKSVCIWNCLHIYKEGVQKHEP